MIGATAGSYRILRQIGEGGMGAVYLGEHSMLGRPAAIKILLPAFSQNREMVGRFFNEARATTAIRHPGIVDIYDFGFLPDGAAFIAMEMLDGESLASRLQRVGRLPVGAAIDIGRQVAAALHAAHSRGITHRDLKPDNIFLVHDPEIGERVKLLDFGIAKLVTEDAANRTRTGVVMGTPLYMSPEQCRGIAGLDSRADLYSLGCVLYELVSGRPPFVAESTGDIIAHHLYFQPDPVRKHDASVPEPLETLIMALLAKEPAMRPASAADVSAILDGWRTVARVSSSSLTHAAQPAAVTVRPGGPIVAAVPTTLSGAAAAVATATGATSRVGSSRPWLRLAAISTVVVAAGAITVAIVMRRPDPSATVAATAPAVPVASASPAAPSPVAPAPVTPPSVAPPPVAPPSVAPPASVDRSAPPTPVPGTVEPPASAHPAKPGQPAEPRPRKPVRVDSSKPAATPTEKRRDTTPAPPAPREEPKAADATATPTPEAQPAPPPPPEVSQKVEPKPAEPSTPAKPITSKWGHLTGDKSVDVDDYRAVQQCKVAAAKGDCVTARAIAARIAAKNVAMYRAQVMTDAAVAACLSSK